MMWDKEGFKSDNPNLSGQDQVGAGPYNGQEAVYFFWEIIKTVIISLAIIVPIRYFLFQPFFVRGASMEDSFHNGDYVLINELGYRFHPPERGEVIVFRYPKDPSQFFIKRVIGLPGEELKVRNNEVVIINADHPQGFILDESRYLTSGQRTEGDFRVKLDPREYFVMGDNREHSSDSRSWGMVNEKLISGRVFLRAWPLNQMSLFKEVDYLSTDLSPANKN